MKATLKQVAKMLSLFEETSGEQIQAILESGLLADICDADVVRINRDEVRKVFGLSPLTLPILTIGVSPRRLEAPYNGWKLVENVESPAGTLTFCLAEFLESGENYVEGEVMRERAKKHNWVLGEVHAQALLDAQDQIPSSWRKFYLVFPGTVWRDPDGRLHVPFLFWYGRRWNLLWFWLERVWGLDDRLVRLCEYSFPSFS